MLHTESPFEVAFLELSSAMKDQVCFYRIRDRDGSLSFQCLAIIMIARRLENTCY